MLLSDLDVVDFVLVVDHQGEGLIGQLPGAVPHQVCPVLNRDKETLELGSMSQKPGSKLLMVIKTVLFLESSYNYSNTALCKILVVKS